MRRKTLLQNKGGFLELDEINPFSLLLGVIGGFFAYWLTGYAGTGLGLGTRIFGGVIGAVLGYFVSAKMFDN